MLKEFSDCGNWKVYGNLSPKILIAGHSHTFAMFSAIQNRPKYQQYFAVVSQSDFSQHKTQDNDYWNFVASIAGSQTTAISWNGNQHNIHFLIDANFRFSAFGLEGKRRYPAVALSQINELFRPTFYELELILSRFQDRTKICLIGTPSPKSKKFLDQRLGKLGTEPFFEEVGRGLGIPREKLAASDDNLRVFMWEITQNLTRKVADQFGSKFLPTPQSTYNKNKILHENFYTQDLTHTNEDFGALMLDEIANFYGITL